MSPNVKFASFFSEGVQGFTFDIWHFQGLKELNRGSANVKSVGGGFVKAFVGCFGKNVLRIRFLPLKLTKLDHLKSIRTRCLRNSWLNQWLVIVISLGSEAYLNQPRMHTGPEKSVSKPERGGFHHTSGLDSLSTKTTSSQSGRFSHLFFRPFFGPFIKAFFFRPV